MKRISRTVLQVIALITMTIDHAGKLFLPYGSVIYDHAFVIGRIAFPLFCLMIAEGAKHTKNIWKYLARILIFACIMEIGLIIAKIAWGLSMTPYLNIFFSLGLGLLIIALLKADKWYKKILAIIPIALLFIANLLIKDITIANFNYPFQFEYGFYGIALMISFALFDKRWLQSLLLIIITFIFCQGGLVWNLGLINLALPMKYQWYGMLAIPIILLYNGQKSKWQLPKYFMYFYYPIHMLALYGLYIITY